MEALTQRVLYPKLNPLFSIQTLSIERENIHRARYPKYYDNQNTAEINVHPIVCVRT